MIKTGKKGLSLLRNLITRPTSVLNRIAEDRSSVVGYHRFVNNPKVTYEKIMEGHYQHVNRNIQGKDLVCVQDTSDYNYDHHKEIIKEGELGTISDNHSLGLRVHPMLVMDKEGFPYGFSSLQILNRAGVLTNRHERDYKKIPIEEKESYRWIKAINESKQRLSGERSLTIVGDRESDIYQLWSRVLDASTHLVIRTSFTRKFLDEKGQEITPVSPPGLLGSYQLYVPGKFGKKDKSRTATLEVFSQQAYTIKPQALKAQKKNTDLDRIPLNVVTVREIIKEGMSIKEPIEWILLTDIRVETLEEAIEIIALYKSRWNIEQIFRLTKQKGFGLEESQLETAHGLKNIIALVLIATVRVYQMVKSRDDQNRQATDIFDQHQLDTLEKIKTGLERKSEKSKNKNKPNTLAYYTWIIERLGNWKPEDKDPPGPITFKRGWETFENYTRINNMIDVCID